MQQICLFFIILLLNIIKIILNIENTNSLAYIVFANIVSDVLIFFNMSQKNAKTGILIQYEKYKYIKKNKNILDVEEKAAGYIHGEKTCCRWHQSYKSKI
jgi:nitrous oxidase accessory protein NosD